MANQPKKYTKFVAAAATATLVASAIVPVASAAGFSDVADTNSHAENINALVEAGIIKGFEDGTFKPGQELTRGHVVKMLGKWVEAQGFEIPADYATKARFNDVAVDAKDQELVKYAALVADTGVFNGSNGALNAGGNITRENMALVLDRAFKAINKTSLVELAAEIEDAKINDLTTAKAEAREAIQALRDLGISVVEDFNPKGTVTRGQFASFLNKTINTEAVVELTVKEAVAVDANTVSVTLSDDTKHTVKLDKALEANKATEIKFTINEKEYTATVTYVVDKLEVVSVSAINAGTIQVKFNTEVKESTLIADGALKSNVITLTPDVNGGTAVDLGNNAAELSEDGKTLTIYTAELEGNYKLAIAKDKVLTADSKIALPAAEAKFNIVDETRASIIDVKNTSKYVFEINVSEPVQETASLAGITAKLEDGTSVISGTPTLTNNGKTIVVTLVADNKNVNAGKDVKVIVPTLTDIAGNVSVPQTQNVKVSNSDIVEPTLVSAAPTSNTTVDVVFSEAVTVDATKFTFNGKAVTVAAKSGDNTKTKFVVTIAEADKSAAAYLELAEGAATDLSGNESLKASKLVTFTGDKVAPTVVSNAIKTIDGVNYLVVKFSEKVTAQTISSLDFKYNDKFGVEQPLTLTSPVITEVEGSKGTEYKVALNDSFKEDVAYSVELAEGSFLDEFANKLAKTTVKFTYNPADTAATKKLVATTATQGVDKDGRFITVEFDKTVDVTSATNAANYTVEGAQVKEVKLATNGTSGASVKVYLVDNTVELSGNYKVTVANVKGFNTAIAAMDKFEETVAISENVEAVVTGKTMTFGTDTVATLTFSEAVTAGTNTDYELFIDGVKVEGTTVATAASDSKELTVTITGSDLSKDIAAGKKVVLKAVESFDIKDAAGNFASTVDVVLN